MPPERQSRKSDPGDKPLGLETATALTPAGHVQILEMRCEM